MLLAEGARECQCRERSPIQVRNVQRPPAGSEGGAKDEGLFTLSRRREAVQVRKLRHWHTVRSYEYSLVFKYVLIHYTGLRPARARAPRASEMICWSASNGQFSIAEAPYVRSTSSRCDTSHLHLRTDSGGNVLFASWQKQSRRWTTVEMGSPIPHVCRAFQVRQHQASESTARRGQPFFSLLGPAAALTTTRATKPLVVSASPVTSVRGRVFTNRPDRWSLNVF